MNYKEYELFFDSLKKGLISLDDVDLDSMDFFNSQKISLINFSRNKMIKNSNNIFINWTGFGLSNIPFFSNKSLSSSEPFLFPSIFWNKLDTCLVLPSK